MPLATKLEVAGRKSASVEMDDVKLQLYEREEDILADCPSLGK